MSKVQPHLTLQFLTEMAGGIHLSTFPNKPRHFPLCSMTIGTSSVLEKLQALHVQSTLLEKGLETNFLETEDSSATTWYICSTTAQVQQSQWQWDKDIFPMAINLLFKSALIVVFKGQNAAGDMNVPIRKELAIQTQNYHRHKTFETNLILATYLGKL